MDTRQKIISTAEAARLAASGAVVVSGHFDPLLAPHASRLAELKRDGTPLMVAITSSPEPVLPVRARAELVAGLRVVDYVVESVQGLVPQIRLESEDAARLEHLIDHVRARQAAR